MHQPDVTPPIKPTLRDATPPAAPPRLPGRSRRVWTIVAIAALLCSVFFAGTTAWLYFRYEHLAQQSPARATSDAKATIAAVGKLLDLPTGETPTVATVQDKNKLRSQAFFAATENGDKVLIYTKTKKAIIYRPRTNRIVNVGPIAVNDSATTATPGTTTAP